MVNCYINSEKESHLKKIVWEQLNKEYMQEQAAKEAAAAAAAKLYTGTPEEIRQAQAMAAAAAKLVASKRQNDKRKRALEAKNAKPPQNAVESAAQHFTKRKLSSKISYDALNNLFDDEVNCYINSEKESHLKKIVWEQLNKEYMQEQAAKEAAAAAAAKLYTGTPAEIRQAQEMAAAASKLVASKRQNDKRKRALDAKNAKPPQNAVESAAQHFTKRKLSSKINYDVLNNLFDDEPSSKKNHIDDSDTKRKESGKKEDEVGEEEDLDYDDGEMEGYGYEEQGMNGYGYEDYENEY